MRDNFNVSLLLITSNAIESIFEYPGTHTHDISLGKNTQRYMPPYITTYVNLHTCNSNVMLYTIISVFLYSVFHYFVFLHHYKLFLLLYLPVINECLKGFKITRVYVKKLPNLTCNQRNVN